MTDWRAIWERKGRAETDDLRVLAGYESTTADLEVIARRIIAELDLQPTDRVLEIGCGAGSMAQYIAPHCEYSGIDTSTSLVKRFRQRTPDAAVSVMEANDLRFAADSFDKTFAFSVCHYFGSTRYFERAREEAMRVTRSSVYLGDLPKSSRDDSHLLFSEDQFDGWTLSPGLHTPLRFNALRSIPSGSARPTASCP